MVAAIAIAVTAAALAGVLLSVAVAEADWADEELAEAAALALAGAILLAEALLAAVELSAAAETTALLLAAELSAAVLLFGVALVI